MLVKPLEPYVDAKPGYDRTIRRPEP
jgi:hypothetical protein